MEISAATDADVPALCGLLGLLFTQETEFHADAERQTAGLRGIINRPDVGQVLVLRDGPHVVGMGSLLFSTSTALGGRVAVLEDMVVRPDARGAGAGSELLQAAIDFARSVGCLRVTLLTDADNTAAQRFYKRHGFGRSTMIAMRLPLMDQDAKPDIDPDAAADIGERSACGDSSHPMPHRLTHGHPTRATKACRHMDVGPITTVDRAALLAVAVQTGLFTADDAESLLGGVLDQLCAGTLPDGHTALACRRPQDAAMVGWTYFAPDQYAKDVWNVWWLGVSPESQGSGAGRILLRAAEVEAHAAGARIVVIETSSKESQARARRFYAKEGYAACGCVPDFYGDGDHKIIYSRRVQS